MVEIGSVVLNVADIGRAATFWRGALGYVPRPGGHLGALVPPSGEGPALLLDETDMTHLDLHVGSEQEQQAEVERLVALGARRVDWVYPRAPMLGSRSCPRLAAPLPLVRPWPAPRTGRAGLAAWPGRRVSAPCSPVERPSRGSDRDVPAELP